MKTIWTYPKIDPNELKEKMQRFNISQAAAAILTNRNIPNEDIPNFLSGAISQLHSPRLLKNAEKATALIKQAIADNWKIAIYGDYDADGIGATAICYKALKMMGANVIYHFNNRFNDGYGMSLKGVEELFQKGVKLIITVDNGITSHDPVKRARNCLNSR